ncbi:MAG: hypothetical protein JXR40_05010 [Pontiellaceae bacterium]|nr:hypothetical protein [Pontiellaceae bacterium]
MKFDTSAFFPVIRDTLLYLLLSGIVILVVPSLYFMGGYGGSFILVICALGFLCIPVFYIFRPKQFRKTKRSKLALVIAVLVVVLLFYFNQPQGRVMRKMLKDLKVCFYINKKDDEIPRVVEVSYANTTDSALLSLYAEE